MAPPCCPSLEGAEVANLVITEKSTGVPQREPSVGDNDRARRARSEAASSTSSNCRLSEHDARWHIIEDWRCLRLRTPSPPRRSLAEDVAPEGKSGFRAMVGPLRQVRWPDKFKTGNINRYDGSSDPEEFI
jgi:hypothetical protein